MTVSFPKKCTARDAMSHIASGMTVFLSSGCGEPQELVEALIAERERFRNVRLLTGLQGSKAPYVAKEYAPYFQFTAFMASARVREAIREGYADYMPVPVSRLPRLFREGVIPIDVALIQVSLPDRNGNYSLGNSVAYTKAAVAAAKFVIAEVNAQMPRTLGDSVVAPGEIDLCVETDRPVIEVKGASLDDALLSIGRHVASLVPEHATMQVGVGATAEAIWQALANRRDLSVHSGAVADGLVDLIETGVVTNRFKPIDRGKVVTGQLIGTKRLNDFAHENPVIDMRPVEYTHDPAVLGQLKDLVSVNSALQVDLRGQVNAETLNGSQVAGVGGALDFAFGATLATGGRSIVALPSTAGDGKYSRIVTHLADAVVTTPATLIDYVVTEYGIAELRGKSLRDRSSALLSVAHPRFQGTLTM
jgi:4-hydroxybutyrate CoA-transferase